MQIVLGDVGYLADWAKLRAELWPDVSQQDHATEIATILSGEADHIGLLAIVGGTVVGFAETAIRRDPVNGCDTSPVAFLEGVFVRPNDQNKGIGRALCDAVERWGQQMGCSELGSDADEENAEGIAFHGSVGFEQTERVVFFRKALNTERRL